MYLLGGKAIPTTTTHGHPAYAQDYCSGILPEVDFIGVDVYPDDTNQGYKTLIPGDIGPITTIENSPAVVEEWKQLHSEIGKP